MNNKCWKCPTRCLLINAEWELETKTNGANIHHFGNARALVSGALMFILHDKENCERCANALDNAKDTLNTEK